MDILDYIDDLPRDGWAVAVFPGRNELRDCLEQYNRARDPQYRTHSLHRAEYVENRETGARMYLRTRRQIIAQGRNRKIDGSQFALLHPDLQMDDMIRRNLEESGITELVPYMDGL